MKRNIIIVFLLALLAATVTGDAYAAYPGKKGGRKAVKKQEQSTRDVARKRKEVRKKEKKERKKLKLERRNARYNNNDEPTEASPTPSAPRNFKYPPTVMKARYRVDIFAAIYLDELVQSKSVTFKDRIPEKAVPGVSFYEGVSMAADSLKRSGFSIDIYVHDAMSASESPEAMISSGGLDSSDLIVAALLPAYLPALADFAKKKKINFVSALAPSDGGISGNKYFTILPPTLQTHCEWIVRDAAKKFPGTKVALLHRTVTAPDEGAYSFVTGTDRLIFRQHLCNSLPRKEDLVHLFDTTKPNIVIIPIPDPVYADSLLKVISRSFPSTHFEVYGMPSWSSMGSLRKDDAFPNLSINVTTPFTADANNPATKYVVRTYKENYGGKASESVLRGYETTFWYANLLKQYGTIFNTNYSDISGAPFTKFRIRPRWDDDGHVRYNENRHIYLTRYEGGLSRTE